MPSCTLSGSPLPWGRAATAQRGEAREHYLIPWEWLRAAVSPLHAKCIRSGKLIQSIEETGLARQRKGTDTNCRKRHIIVPACTSSLHVATCTGDQLPSAVMLLPVSRTNAAYPCFRCASPSSLLCPVTSELRGKEAHLNLEHKGTYS